MSCAICDKRPCACGCEMYDGPDGPDPLTSDEIGARGLIAFFAAAVGFVVGLLVAAGGK